MHQLIRETRALALDFDQCAFGAPSVKPTRPLCSTDLLDGVCVRCPGNHVHIQLKGKVRDPDTGKFVFRTKSAQVHPWALCAVIALHVAARRHDPLAHLELYSCFDDASLRSEKGPGVRPSPGGHSLEGPVGLEMEPGQAVRAAILTIHPARAARMVLRGLLAPLFKKGVTCSHFGRLGLACCCPARLL